MLRELGRDGGFGGPTLAGGQDVYGFDQYAAGLCGGRIAVGYERATINDAKLILLVEMRDDRTRQGRKAVR